MTTINLTQFFFGRRKRKKNKGGGSGVPTPSLPNAGKPKVSAFNYDKDARKVTVVASVDRAGEVKTPIGDPQEFSLPPVPSAGSPLVQAADFSFDKDANKVRLRASNPNTGEVENNVGEWQEFPIEVPEPTPLPDAGKPFVESVTYDPDTKKVSVRAKVAQAGEVKTPEGELQEFPIHVPTPPAPPAPTLPDAGKPRVSKFDYDPSTRKVTVQASVSQAGEVKTPTGDEQTFDIPAEATPPAAPGFKGYFYRFLVDDESISGSSIGGIVATDLGQVISANGETKTIETKKYPLTPGTTNAYKLQIDCLPDYVFRILPEDAFSVEDGYLCITRKIKFIDASKHPEGWSTYNTSTYPISEMK